MIDGRAIYLWLRLLITGVPLRFLHIQPSCHTKPSLSLQFSYFGIPLSYFHTLVILLSHKTISFPPIFILWLPSQRFHCKCTEIKSRGRQMTILCWFKNKKKMCNANDCFIVFSYPQAPNWHFLCPVFANFKTKTRFPSLTAVCLSALSAVHLQARNYLFLFEEPPITTLYGSAKAERRFQWGGNFAHLWTSKRKDEVTIRKGKQFFFLWSQKVQSWLSWRRGAYLPELLTLGWYLLVIFCLRRFKTIIQLVTNTLPKHLSPIIKY